MTIQLSIEPDGMVLTSPYNKRMVDDLKAKIPATLRKWDGTRKVWIFDPDAFIELAALVRFHFGVTLRQPMNTNSVAPQIKILTLEYLGQCKDRGDGKASAMGWVSGGWNVVMPEDVLRKWFGGGVVRPGAGTTTTLYGTLGITDVASSTEVKSAYRRLARQWHPDICHEPDAAQVFMQIQAAYEMLTDPVKRKKYDAGLKFAASMNAPALPPKDPLDALNAAPYRAPLRCGYVMMDCQERLGRFIASDVMQWQDITDKQGRTMVSFWPKGAQMFQVVWV